MDSYGSFTQPGHRFTLPFERNYSPAAAKRWMQDNWYSGFYLCAMYIVIIFALKFLMLSCKPFILKKPLLLWNIFLASFSVLAFCRTVPEFFHKIMMHKGVYHSVCDNSDLKDENVTNCWSFLFALSKLLEVGDTLFIVLRKKPLIFLHWYHHVLTLLYTWFSFQESTASTRWFMNMNTFIHSFMYSYYALIVLRIHIPKFISIVITAGQILQMAVGCWVNYKIWRFMSSSLQCDVTRINLIVSSLMYASYFVLFVRFFYYSYIICNDKKRKRKFK